ncbi:hypothetical protein [Actinoplanes derwentensis]|uniref:hypothetical protein n=1 Tax=Actinoplanes derwentensis TaxID=113562 RepID=UPI000A6ABAFD|nr:hypothetical protein [Actinoplanes derwentensis]GID81644.1 hypothetical protein Ade03nite_05680 [Actinoplanes derwentensis]
MHKVYNLALQARTEGWSQRRERVGYSATSALSTAWKKTEDLAFLNEVSSVPLQQCLRHLHGAFVAFWEKRARYPRFKSKRKSRASAEFTASAFRWRNGELTLAKMSVPLDVVWPARNGPWPARRRARRTGTRPGVRSPASTPGSPTGAVTPCIS